MSKRISLDEFKEKLDLFAQNNINKKEEVIRIIGDYGSVIKYDNKGNIIYMRDKEGNEQNWEYGKFGVTYYSNSATNTWDRYEFDEQGNVIKHTNQNNEITTFEYNSKNSLIKKTTEKDNETHIALYDYDNQDRLIYFREDNKYAIKREYLDDTEVNFIEYYYNGENDTIDISYNNYLTNVKTVKLLNNGTKQWYEDQQLIKQIPETKKRKV